MSVNNCVSTKNGSDNGSYSCGTNGTNIGTSTPVMTPEPKSASIPSGSRSEIHYPGVQNPSRIYDSKKNRKIIRIMTVMAYVFAVSLAAIVLSLYYVFLWDPNMQIHNNTAPSLRTSPSPSPSPSTEGKNISLVSEMTNLGDTDVHKMKKHLVSSAQLLTLMSNITEPTISTISTISSPATTTRTNVKTANYSASVALSSVLSSVDRKRDNLFKFVSKTNSTNASSAVETDKSFRNSENTKYYNKLAANVTETNRNHLKEQFVTINNVNTSNTKNYTYNGSIDVQ